MLKAQIWGWGVGNLSQVEYAVFLRRGLFLLCLVRGSDLSGKASLHLSGPGGPRVIHVRSWVLL